MAYRGERSTFNERCTGIEDSLDPSFTAAKMFVPRTRRELVGRQRLTERLENSARSRLTLVAGPAGFGKTTLLATWLTESLVSDSAVAWLSLDPADEDSATFWRLVVTALDAAVPGRFIKTLQLVGAESMSTERVLPVLIHDLAATPQDVWLVLDDFHAIQSSAVHADLAFLLDRLPTNIHVVLSTRADPDLPLSRWRAGGELVEIRAVDLRFTAEETVSFLNGVSGLGLSGENVELLGHRTEGWIAALQLAALSLKGREDPSGFISRFAGNDKYIVDYLVDEVLAHQTPEIREFLIQSAVLDRLTGQLCDAVTGRNDGHDVLVSLERANLFLFPLDDHREWYRYHHLFADVLRGRLLQSPSEDVAFCCTSAPAAGTRLMVRSRTPFGMHSLPATSTALPISWRRRYQACVASGKTQCYWAGSPNFPMTLSAGAPCSASSTGGASC